MNQNQQMIMRNTSAELSWIFLPHHINVDPYIVHGNVNQVFTDSLYRMGNIED